MEEEGGAAQTFGERIPGVSALGWKRWEEQHRPADERKTEVVGFD
jgi:hypothetical protein